MPETRSTREITDYLRGVGVMAVLVTHYAGAYDHDFYAQYLSNYANAFMAVFFILAGYGAYHSFERRFSAGRPTVRVIAAYFVDRALRIYPLYWLALVMTAIISAEYFPVHELSLMHLLAAFAALPVIINPLWFVPAIVMCYVFAPFLYLLLKWIGCRKYVIFNVALVAVLLIISHEYLFLLASLGKILPVGRIPNPAELLNRGIFLGNVFLFSLGLLTPPLIRMYGDRMKSWVVLYTSLFSLLGLSLILRYDVLVWHKAQLMMEAGYYSSVFFFCLSTLVMKPGMPFRRHVAVFGMFSYSIYLFHDVWLIQILEKAHLLKLELPLSLALVLILLPAMMWACIVSEKGSGILRDRIRRFSRKITGSDPVREGAPRW